MLSAVSLSVYSTFHDLTPSVAFTTIAIYGQIEMVLSVIPEVTAEALEAGVSASRIEEHIGASERNNYIIPGEDIAFNNASVAWPSEPGPMANKSNRFVLQNLNLRFPNKELTVISGKTGEGKSLLLASILGEAELLTGSISMPKTPTIDRYDSMVDKTDWIVDSAVAYVAQVPWIENATIKDNILFGSPFDLDRYHKVLSSCSLIKDLETFSDYDLTDIGANGINLSGGQRWRISFARALYSRAGILVLDDVFSALDTHVGRQLFEQALVGEMGKGRTRILVTHHVDLCLPKAKYMTLLGEGGVVYAGFVADLQRDGRLKTTLKQNEERLRREDLDGEINGSSSIMQESIRLKDVKTSTQGLKPPKKFTEEEQKETGPIKLGIYNEYLVASGGWWFWVTVVMMFVAHQGFVVGRSWWVGLWTRLYKQDSVIYFSEQAPSSLFNNLSRTFDDGFRGQQSVNLWFYLFIYVGISLLICISGAVRYLFLLLGSLRASRVLFEKLTYRILRAPLRWLDTVPVGRILSRFT